MARSKETPHTAATETDDVQQSLELLDRVLLEFEDPSAAPPRSEDQGDGAGPGAVEPPPPPEEAARLISALMPRGSPRGSPGQSLRRSPPDPGGPLQSPSQATAATQTTLPKARHMGSKKLSSRFGSLPFDLSSHAAPQQTPEWLQVLESRAQARDAAEPRDVASTSSGCTLGDRNLLHLPIQNPLTTSLSQEPNTSSSGSDVGDDEEQFSDDSLEGQVSSSDREADFRDLGSTTSHECAAEEESEGRQRGSIAWDIPLDWDLDQALEASASKKRRQDKPSIGVSRSQPQTPMCPPPPLPTSVSGGGSGTYVIRDRKKRPALEDAFLYCPVIPTSATYTSGLSHISQYKKQPQPQHQHKARMMKGTSLPTLQTYKQPSHYSKPLHVPDNKFENHQSNKMEIEIEKSNHKNGDRNMQVDDHENNSVDIQRENHENGVENEQLTKYNNCLKDEQLENHENGISDTQLGNHESSTDEKQSEEHKKGEKEVGILNKSLSAKRDEIELHDEISENINLVNNIPSPQHNSIHSESDNNLMCNNIESKENCDVLNTSDLSENCKEQEKLSSSIDKNNEDDMPDIEMSFKIMRPKKIRPHSMPPSEDNIVVFKSTVQIESSDKSKHKKMRPISMPPNEVEPLKTSPCEVVHVIPEPVCEQEPEPDYSDAENSSLSPAEAQPEKERPKSVFISKSSEAMFEMKMRPISCSDINFSSTRAISNEKISVENSASSKKDIPPTTSSPSNTVQICEEKRQVENQPSLPCNSSEVQDVPDSLVSNEKSLVPNCITPSSPTRNCSDVHLDSLDLEMPPPPSSSELENEENEHELLAESQDKVEVPLTNFGTVSSLVQTDISALYKKHKLSCDSPSEEQVVPSLSYRTNILLTPDEPPIDKTLSTVVLSNFTIDEDDVTGIKLLNCNEDSKKTELEPMNKVDSDYFLDKSNNDDESITITTVIIETKDDEPAKKDQVDPVNNFEPIKRPTDLFSCKPSLETKLSRDSQRRKSHGSTLEMTTRAAENRRSAPECSFLFPQGHYTIPLSFAVTNKPPGRPQQGQQTASQEKTPAEPSKTIVEAVNIETRPAAPLPVTTPSPVVPVNPEPTYKSIRKNKPSNGVAKRNRSDLPPPLPPHQNLSPMEDEYAEPRNIPDFSSSSRKQHQQHNSRASRPRNLVTHKENSQQPPPLPPHQTDLFEAEKPLPPTPLTPVQNTKLSIMDDFDTHPLPPSPHSPKPCRPLPTSATFPVPPSPASLHKMSKSQLTTSSPHTGRRRMTPPSPLLPRPPSPPRSRPHPAPASPVQLHCTAEVTVDASSSRAAPRRPLPSPPESDYGFVTREPGTTGLGSLKTRSVDAGLGRGLREQLQTSISQSREVGADRRTLPTELSGATPRRHMAAQYNTGLRQAKKKGRAPTVPPHASLPETPVFTRGCDIPRGPYRPPAVGIPVLRSSLSEEGDRLVLCGPARGWYPKQRQNKPARSTENLDQASSLWGEPRKPQTLPPNLNPPKFFHRSPREALRRVTSLLIRRGSSSKEPRAPKEVVSPNGASGSQCETPQRQKRSFFRNFWKKSKHYSLEQ